MDNAYLDTASCSEQTFASTDFEIKQETFDSDNNASLLSWSQYANQPAQQQADFMNVLGTTELNIPTLVDQFMWPMEPVQSQSQQPQQQIGDPSFNSFFAPWNSNVQVTPTTIKEECSLNHMEQQQILTSMPYQQESQSFMIPPTSPVKSPSTFNNIVVNEFYAVQPPPQYFREITPPSSTSASESNSPNSIVSTPPLMSYYLPQETPQSQQPTAMNTPVMKAHCGPARRKSAKNHTTPTRTYRRRVSSHLSVASVVSLSAHEPVARIIDGIEHISFLYSHDRLVKEYTVRTDVDHVNLQDIPVGFRVQNAIYPRANVSREEYDGNRWEYETSCNKLGWELCWLNQQQLCGRRGLIQRVVDSYRNRHADMRSRRVTRQEKVANGTLRKRRAKKSIL